jgi:hypothetical protein
MSAIAQPTLQTGIAAHRSKAKTRYDDWAPTTKVSAGALGGAATILLTAFLAHWTQKDMAPAVVTAITTIVTFLIQYLVPDRRT